MLRYSHEISSRTRRTQTCPAADAINTTHPRVAPPGQNTPADDRTLVCPRAARAAPVGCRSCAARQRAHAGGVRSRRDSLGTDCTGSSSLSRGSPRVTWAQLVCDCAPTDQRSAANAHTVGLLPLTCCCRSIPTDPSAHWRCAYRPGSQARPRCLCSPDIHGLVSGSARLNVEAELDHIDIPYRHVKPPAHTPSRVPKSNDQDL